MKWWEKKKEVTTIWQACKTPDGLDYYFNTVTNETTWDKPDELMTDEEKDAAGDWQWVPDEAQAYIPGKKLRDDGKFAYLQMEDGSERKVPLKQIEPLKKSSLQRVPDDLVLLDQMSGPLILHCLKQRFMDDKIYTNVGTIVISVNPYQRLPIYGRDVIEKYMMRGMEERPPHVFNIGHEAFKGMKEFGINQSVIISGESGAGKTEATKQVLAYIAAIAGSVGGVEKKVLQANPILEAFGNAKTIRNDNSSRFGKYMEIFFASDGRISGAVTTNYLLEKIRVVQQAPNERNYHIFYQLVKGAAAPTKKKYFLENVDNFKYLAGGGCTEVKSIDDVADFKVVEQAFKDLGWSANDAELIYSVVSGVLHLGNLDFKDKGAAADVVDMKWVEKAASCLLIPQALLQKALLVRTLKIRGQPNMDVALKRQEASDARHALAKFIYGAMFDWLVIKINKSMASNTANSKSIGCLDIFGFEIFKHNSFEQLCINFTNEMLQQHFNNQTFKLEEAIYKAEKITFKHVEFIDNKPMIELITNKPNGILPLLDEELVVPQGTDKTFVAKLHQAQKSNAVYKTVLKNPDHFIVKHYAGEVVYDTEHFLEKNRDTLTDDLTEAVRGSTNPLINQLFPPGEVTSTADKKSSLSKQFQNQLQDLMATLNKTEPHYVRCVKPNETKAPRLFIPKNCFEQLLYSGVFEAVSIRKQGFPFRLKHDIFAKRYGVILNTTVTPDVAGCKQILAALKFPKENVQMGTTLVLYRADEHKKLELDRSIKVMTQQINEQLTQLCNVSVSGMDNKAKEEYFDKLAMAVRQADEFRLKGPVADKARKLLDDYIEARMDPETKRMLEDAIKTMDMKKLSQALAEAALHGYRTSLTRKASELLEQVSDAEAALAASIEQVDLEMLERSLKMCSDFKYAVGTVPVAKKLRDDIVKTNSELEAAKSSKDHIQLQNSLQMADGISLDTLLVNECRALYKKVLDARAQLEAAQAAVDQYAMESALAVCDGFGYRAQLVTDVRHLCDRVTRINVESEGAKDTLEEDHVRICVQAADEIGMNSEWLAYFRQLVNGDYDAFLEAQYNKAVQLQNPDRAVRIAMKRKDLLVQTKGSSFVLAQYQKLKSPQAWGNEKLFGKEKRAATFLKWQADIIHSPLIAHNIQDKNKRTDVRKTTRVCFESIMKHMGQKKSKQRPGLRTSEMLRHALRLPEIRSELYIHLLKQIDTNIAPNAGQAIPLAWELMALFLCTFPPTPDFENYLEVIFRSPTHQAAAAKYKCTGLIRRIVYHGQTQSPASEGECANIQNYLSSRMGGFEDPRPSNAYDDLRQPYVGPSQGGGYGGGGPKKGGGGAMKAGGGGPMKAGGGGGGMYGGGAAAAAKPAAKAAPAPAKPKPAYTPWRPVLDESSGDYYYYNEETGESTWDKPDGVP